MKIKKYEASTEKEAMLKVKDDLGKDALIVSVKNIKPKGIYKIFKKPYVEVTAALDDLNVRRDQPTVQRSQQEILKPVPLVQNAPKSNVLQEEDFIKLLQGLSDMGADNRGHSTVPTSAAQEPIDEKTMDMPFLKLIYEQLLEREVEERYINKLMEGLVAEDETAMLELDEMISVVYKRIVKQLGDAETIKLEEGKTKVVVFVGPTGVGKTTTIAKIASHFALNLGKQIALITADTYRIAAVEQLRTYANILNVPLKVVYAPDEMKSAVAGFSDKDMVLVDTAGRSPKDASQHAELTRLLDEIDEKEIYLVLNLGTKYKDLIQIIDAYSDVAPYRMIFTKLDETTEVGNILNLKFKSDSTLSYITFGQNVPDDISEINVHEIAKKVLGGGL